MRCAQCSRGSQPPKAALHQRSQKGVPPLNPPRKNDRARAHIASGAALLHTGR